MMRALCARQLSLVTMSSVSVKATKKKSRKKKMTDRSDKLQSSKTAVKFKYACSWFADNVSTRPVSVAACRLDAAI